MKINAILGALILLLSCRDKPIDKFDVYSDSINIEFKDSKIDTVYIANNFPNFKIKVGKFTDDIFEWGNLNRNEHEYIEIIPNSKFWNNTLLRSVKTKNHIQFKRFDYHFENFYTNMGFQEGPNLNRTYIIFSPIYFDEKNNKGFFIVSETNNRNIGFTTAYYIKKENQKFIISSVATLHRFLPQ